jgi:hypothetical protein
MPAGLSSLAAEFQSYSKESSSALLEPVQALSSKTSRLLTRGWPPLGMATNQCHSLMSDKSPMRSSIPDFSTGMSASVY